MLKGGRGLQCNECLCSATIPQGKHARAGVWGDSRGRVGLPSIHWGLWGCLVGLSTQSPWGTDVPLTAPNWQHATSCHFGNATTLQSAAVGRKLTWTASIPKVSEMLATPTGTKWWHHSSDQDTTTPRPEEEEAARLDITPKEWPHQKWKEGRPLVRPLKESCQEAFGTDSKLIQSNRQAYFKMHHPNYDHEGSTNFSHTFKEMATSAYLMDSYIHEVQEVWSGWKDLWVTCCMVKSSPKDIHFFWVMPPTESPKIMGLRGIHSPEAWAGDVVCPSACGVVQDRMKTWWWTTCEWATITLASFAADALNTSPSVLTLCNVTHSCVSWCQPASRTMMTTRRKNLTLMIMVRMISLHLARISTAPLNSCWQQSNVVITNLMFMPGWASLASPWQSSLFHHSFLNAVGHNTP